MFHNSPLKDDVPQIDEYIDKLRKQKLVTGDGAQPEQLSALDMAAEGIRLKSEMQRAVEEERYADAAKFRDLLAEVDRQSKKAKALAGEWNVKLQPVLRLGQRVIHKKWGWRGVVAGWDSRCCETDDWVDYTRAKELARGVEQPYYYVMVDMRDWQEVDENLPPCAYVAEELLTAPELEDGTSWVQAHGPDPLQHVYAIALFLGQDGKGDLLPCRQLRNKYNVARRDVPKPDEPPSEDDSSN